MTEILGCRVVGIPVTQGSKKLVQPKRKDGTLTRARIIDDNPHRLKTWRKNIYDSAKAALPIGWQPTVGPVRVVLLFALPRPASASTRRRVWPSGHVGDVDKLARAALDALSDARVWRDDCQVVDLRAIKDYPGPDIEQMSPGLLITVYRVDHAAHETSVQEGLPIA